MFALRRGGTASNITLAWDCPHRNIASQRSAGGLYSNDHWHVGSTYRPSRRRCTYGRERCGRAGASTSSEWIEYGLSLKSEATDQRHQRGYRLLRRMELVAAVGHLHHIAQRLFRQRRSALGQQKRLLMLIAEEPALRAVALAKRRCVRQVENPRYAMLRRTHRSSSTRRT